jgi:hypothetical protein
MKRLPLLAAAAVALALATACGPAYRIEKRAPENPLGVRRALYVEPLSWESVRVAQQGEKEYLAGKTPDQVAAWQLAKERAAEVYRSELIERARDMGAIGGYAPSPDGLVVKSKITAILTGSYLVLPTSVELQVVVADPRGKPLEQVHTSADVASDTFSTLATSLRATAQILARRVNDYLHDRATGKLTAPSP